MIMPVQLHSARPLANKSHFMIALNKCLLRKNLVLKKKEKKNKNPNVAHNYKHRKVTGMREAMGSPVCPADCVGVNMSNWSTKGQLSHCCDCF